VAYLILIGVSALLLVGFYTLTWYEARRGLRFFASRRRELDRQVSRVEFIIKHVDFAALGREEMYRFVTLASHAVAQFSLQTVRAVERILTRLVRHLRTEHPVDMQAGESPREFVKTLSDFKVRLKDTATEAPVSR